MTPPRTNPAKFAKSWIASLFALTATALCTLTSAHAEDAPPLPRPEAAAATQIKNMFTTGSVAPSGFWADKAISSADRKRLDSLVAQMKLFLPGDAQAVFTSLVADMQASELYRGVQASPQLSSAAPALLAVAAARKLLDEPRDAELLRSAETHNKVEAEVIRNRVASLRAARLNFVESLTILSTSDAHARGLVRVAVNEMRENPEAFVGGGEKEIVAQINNLLIADHEKGLADAQDVRMETVSYAEEPILSLGAQRDPSAGDIPSLVEEARRLFPTPKAIAEALKTQFHLSADAAKKISNHIEELRQGLGEDAFTKAGVCTLTTMRSSIVQDAFDRDDGVAGPATFAARYATCASQAETAQITAVGAVRNDPLAMPDPAAGEAMVARSGHMLIGELIAKQLAAAKKDKDRTHQRVLVEWVMEKLMDQPLAYAGRDADEAAQIAAGEATARYDAKTAPTYKQVSYWHKKHRYWKTVRIDPAPPREQRSYGLLHGLKVVGGKGSRVLRIKPADMAAAARMGYAEAGGMPGQGEEAAIATFYARQLVREFPDTTYGVVTSRLANGYWEYEPNAVYGGFENLPKSPKASFEKAKEVACHFRDYGASLTTFFMDRQTVERRGSRNQYLYNMYSRYGYVGERGIEGRNHEMNMGDIEYGRMTLYAVPDDTRVECVADEPAAKAKDGEKLKKKKKKYDKSAAAEPQRPETMGISLDTRMWRVAVNGLKPVV